MCGKITLCSWTNASQIVVCFARNPFLSSSLIFCSSEWGFVRYYHETHAWVWTVELLLRLMLVPCEWGQGRWLYHNIMNMLKLMCSININRHLNGVSNLICRIHHGEGFHEIAFLTKKLTIRFYRPLFWFVFDGWIRISVLRFHSPYNVFSSCWQEVFNGTRYAEEDADHEDYSKCKR